MTMTRQSGYRRASGVVWPMLFVGVACLVSAGCVSQPYRFGQRRQPRPEPTAPTEVVIEQGQPGPTIRRLAHIVDTPSRILPFGHKHKRHEISPETAEKLKTYLQKNDLTDVYVYVNHYDPRSQWRRLRENTAISPVWRYSLGTFSMIGYTLLPHPVFSRNAYNPYTNSLYLNSDIPVDVLYEAAVAKDIHSHSAPGTYAAMTSLPGVSLVRRTRAVGDVVGYARVEQDWVMERDAYRTLYPRVGSETTNLGASFVAAWWAGPALNLGGAAVGRVAGHALETRRDKELSPPVVVSSAVQPASFQEELPAAAVLETSPTVERLPMP